MRRFAVILAFLATAAQADAIYKSPALTVQLTDQPCTSERLAGVLAQEGKTSARVALVTLRGAPVVACWSFDEDGDVLIADENGKAGFIERRAFRPLKAI